MDRIKIDMDRSRAYRVVHCAIILLLAILAVLCIKGPVHAGDYSVGVYYFPGWRPSPGEWWSPPWEKIKPHSEREPLLGFYPEGETRIAEKHLEWMSLYGIDFIVYDWYWKAGVGPHLDHAVKAYLQARNRDLVRFSILWANHAEIPVDEKQYDAIVDHWIGNYFNQKQYLTIDGKPVVFIFSLIMLRDYANKLGRDVNSLLLRARSRALRAGLKGIYFIAMADANEYWVKEFIPKNGFDAVSGYNYHQGISGKDAAAGYSRNYEELAYGYRQNWDWILRNSRLPYLLPVTSGWNSRPWGGNTAHDDSVSTPDSFRRHLLDAKGRVDLFPDRTLRTVMICCWNEFGEGSYIEPTRKWQFQYLQQVKDVFGK